MRFNVGHLLLLATIACANVALPPRREGGSGFQRKPGALSSITFSHLNPLLRLGAQRPLEESDLPSMQWHSDEVTSDFEREFDALRAVGTADMLNAAPLALL